MRLSPWPLHPALHLALPRPSSLQVIVKKDAKGLLGADWHLQSVDVWQPVLKKRYFFICNDWLKASAGFIAFYLPVCLLLSCVTCSWLKARAGAGRPAACGWCCPVSLGLSGLSPAVAMCQLLFIRQCQLLSVDRAAQARGAV